MLINQFKFRSLSGNPLLVMPNDGDTLLQSAKGTTNKLCKLHDCVSDDTGIIYDSELIQKRSIRTYTCIPTHKTTDIVAPCTVVVDEDLERKKSTGLIFGVPFLYLHSTSLSLHAVPMTTQCLPTCWK